MPRYRVSWKTDDGRLCERTLRADDPAAALGTVLDEHSHVDKCCWFVVTDVTRPGIVMEDLAEPLEGTKDLRKRLKSTRRYLIPHHVSVSAPIAALLEKLTGCKVEKEPP